MISADGGETNKKSCINIRKYASAGKAGAKWWISLGAHIGWRAIVNKLLMADDNVCTVVINDRVPHLIAQSPLHNVTPDRIALITFKISYILYVREAFYFAVPRSGPYKG